MYRIDIQSNKALLNRIESNLFIRSQRCNKDSSTPSTPYITVDNVKYGQGKMVIIIS